MSGQSIGRIAYSGGVDCPTLTEGMPVQHGAHPTIQRRRVWITTGIGVISLAAIAGLVSLAAPFKPFDHYLA
jgi:hypothetical protein